MAEINFRNIVTVEATLTLTEAEIGALDALAGYGTEAFLNCFYKHMGQAYLKRHEKGLISLFEKIRQTAGPALGSANDARRTLSLEFKSRLKDRQALLNKSAEQTLGGAA